jgi:hypothetical protein
MIIKRIFGCLIAFAFCSCESLDTNTKDKEYNASTTKLVSPQVIRETSSSDQLGPPIEKTITQQIIFKHSKKKTPFPTVNELSKDFFTKATDENENAIFEINVYTIEKRIGTIGYDNTRFGKLSVRTRVTAIGKYGFKPSFTKSIIYEEDASGSLVIRVPLPELTNIDYINWESAPIGKIGWLRRMKSKDELERENKHELKSRAETQLNEFAVVGHKPLIAAARNALKDHFLGFFSDKNDIPNVIIRFNETESGIKL